MVVVIIISGEFPEKDENGRPRIQIVGARIRNRCMINEIYEWIRAESCRALEKEERDQREEVREQMIWNRSVSS